MAEIQLNDGFRHLVDAKLAEIAAYARTICPAARVETDTLSYDGEAGHLDIYPPPTLTEEEEEEIEHLIYARADEIEATTGLFILCAVLSE